MKELTVRKIEGKYYICEDKENKFFAIDISEMPTEVKSGDKIKINDDGIIELMTK